MELIFFLVLFLSGFASLINQVVWQRASKIYLGGADALCSMLVVLAFMLGLGVGSLFGSRRAPRLKDPVRALALVEGALAVVNLIVLILLRFDLSDSIYAFQRTAISIGVPITLLYGLTGLTLFLIPCFLMGLTMPIASEGAHRQLGYTHPWLVDLMFCCNTMGAFAGALFTGFKLLPFYGQTSCLVLAVLLHLVSALFLLFVRPPPTPSSDHRNAAEVAAMSPAPTEMGDTSLRPQGLSGTPWWRLRHEEIATFFLGFVSLGYEMYLFRVVPLVLEPLPHTFSMVLACYLLAWAIGVLIAGRLRDVVLPSIAIGALCIALTPYVIMYDRLVADDFSSLVAQGTYFFPCLIFGILFGQLLNRFIRNWGTDVGRFMGLNTLGSCLGIVVTTLLGGGIYHAFNAWILAAIMQLIGIWLFLQACEIAWARRFCHLGPIVASLVILSLLGVEGSIVPHVNKLYITYSDPVGVTEITRGGNLIWDGLWHSALSNGRNHIGSPNWWHAVIPFLCMPDGPIDEALIIGLGAGITAGTLASSRQVGLVRSYEINRSIRLILRDYPAQTLNVLGHPKIEIVWQDARSGLALDERKYPLISQQPLYLKQAGSSTLLSEEYLRLVSRRLADGGVFLVYANSQGRKAQKLLVRKTLASVFPHVVSFMGGYMYVASHSPISYTLESLRRKLSVADDPLVEEIKAHFRLEDLLRLKDPPDDAWKKCPLTIRDDHPVLEYPEELEEMSKSWG